jgi:hypothetical protein
MLRMNNLVLAIQSLLVIKGTDCNSRVIQRRLAQPNPTKGEWPDCARLGGRYGAENALADRPVKLRDTTRRETRFSKVWLRTVCNIASCYLASPDPTLDPTRPRITALEEDPMLSRIDLTHL